MKIAACVEYNGTAYCGWQRLKAHPSVQQEVEKSLSRIANEPIQISCAGRTDSGVHAVGQVIHFETQAERSSRSWQMGANTYLSDDIALRWVSPIAEDFHARFSAKSRYYRYIILNRASRSALLHHQAHWYPYSLNIEKMHHAAQDLLGTHDFSSFRAAGCQAPHANREVQAISVKAQGDFIYIDIQANAFLYHMVRNIVGSLLVIGRDKQTPNWMAELLKQKDRTLAGMTAPASGLYFVKVDYPHRFKLDIPMILPQFS